MSFNLILKRASSFLGFVNSDDSNSQFEDGDIVYSKNNVCVHTPSHHRGEGPSIHHPGYMVVKCQYISPHSKTLTLSWIPNERLKRNHELIHKVGENSGSDLPYFKHDSDSVSLSSLNIIEIKGDDKIADNFDLSEVDEGTEALEEHIPDPKQSPSHDTNQGTTDPNEELNFGESHSDHGPTDREIGFLLENSPDVDVFHAEDVKGSSVEGSSSGIFSEGSVPSPMRPDDNDVLMNDDKKTIDITIITESSDLKVEIPESEDAKRVDISSRQYLLDKSEVNINNGMKPDSFPSSESSLEHEKAVETSESSFQVDAITDDEISLSESCDANSPPPKYFSSKARDQWYDRSAESMAYCANLSFPESPSIMSSHCPTPIDGGSSPIRRQHKCGIFNIDVGKMKSLRLFFSDKDRTCGQLVITSQESQYKILHFHYGGLDKLASVFEDWNFLIGPSKNSSKNVIESPTNNVKQFSVCRPQIEASELHPDEGSYGILDAEDWLTYFSEDGLIEDDLALRKAIFFGGIEPSIRTNVYPFLLHYYDFRTSFLQRQMLISEKQQLYEKINHARLNLSTEESEDFFKKVQNTVEKDVVRTDRSKPCFAGANNPNLEKMRTILLNFAFANPEQGYTQGMSDILAPILAEVRTEVDVFWCFTGMMSKTIFVTSPRDKDMEKNLKYLVELLKLMVPSFYKYISDQEDGLDLLFCHRWILLCFKREFSEDEVLSIWEACWSNYQTDYFHLFMVVALVSIYGKDVIIQKMRADETLLYFTSLAFHMDGYMALNKARGLLHYFRQQERLPCSLIGLCELCGPGMWDSGHAPVVECEGHDEGPTPCKDSLAYLSKLDTYDG